MNLPSGLVFYLDFQYGTAKTPFALDGSLYGTQNADNFGTAASNLGQTFADGGLYGAGKFTYSTNQFSSSLVAGTVATATSASINFDSRLDPGALKTLTIATSSIPNFDAEAVRGFVPQTSSVALGAGVLPLSAVYPAFTTLSGENIVFVVSGSDIATNAGAGYKIFYNKATSKCLLTT
jgi:hypothetical protein